MSSISELTLALKAACALSSRTCADPCRHAEGTPQLLGDRQHVGRSNICH